MSAVNSPDEEWMVDEGNEGETTIVMQEMAFIRPWKILIVDDEKNAREGLALALQKTYDVLLADNDSHRALALAGDLVVTGPTGTNVADVQILLLGPQNPLPP